MRRRLTLIVLPLLVLGAALLVASWTSDSDDQADATDSVTPAA